MEPTLHIRLLGDFSLIYADRQVTSLNTMRPQSLLAYLVLHRDVPQQRQHLAFLLWPDTTETQARNNLRQLLHQLRQALPSSDRFLMADASGVCWKTDAAQVIDVLRFVPPLSGADAAEQGGDSHDVRRRLEQ